LKKTILAVLLASLGSIVPALAGEVSQRSLAQTSPNAPQVQPEPSGDSGPAAGPVDGDDAGNEAGVMLDESGAPVSLAMPSSDPQRLPKLELTPEIMFKVLASEIAFQREDWQSAFATEYELSQSTRDPRLAQRATEFALAARQFDPALMGARRWTELDPDSDRAQQVLLGLTISNNALTDARPVLERKLSSVQPQQRGVMLLQIGRLLGNARDKNAAFGLMQVLAARYPDVAEGHLAVAIAARAAGDSARAVQGAQTSVRMAPDSELVVLTAAPVLDSRDKSDALLKDFLVRHPDSREARFAYARSLTEQKQYANARTEFQEIYRRDQKDMTALIALGLLNAELGDMEQAEIYLKSYIAALAEKPDPRRDTTQALSILAQISLKRNDVNGALDWLAKVGPGQNYLNVQFDRARLEASRGRLPAALKVIDDAAPTGEIEIVRAHQVKAELLEQADRRAEARKVLLAAQAQYPDNTDLLYDLAILDEKDRQYEQMEQRLRRIIQLAPENQHAYNALGYSLAERGVRLDEARQLIGHALMLAPRDPFIRDSMGWVEFRRGSLESAHRYLEAAWTETQSPEIGVHLGEVLWQQNQQDQAREVWRKVQQRTPADPLLKETLIRLKVAL